MIGRLLRTLLTVLLLLLVFLAVLLRVRHGGGAEFPDRTGDPVLPGSAVETVAELPTPAGNIAVSAGGRVFVSLHPEARPHDKVVELVRGAAVPYPTPGFQDGDGEPRYFRSVLSLRIDRQERLWTLDYAHHGSEPGRLMAFDLATNSVAHEFEFPRDIAGLGSHLNDFQVSPDGNWIYIADASIFGKKPALIVYDVAHHQARRVLERHPSVMPDFYTPVVQGRRMEVLGLFAIRPGVDSIGLDARGEWLYFAPVTSLNMYRVRTADLRDAALPPAGLAGRVEVHAPKTMSDGIILDPQDTLYMAEPEHSAIVALRADRTLVTLLKDDRLRWPDGFSWGPDGWLYFTCSSLHQVIGQLPSSVRDHAPYQVFRFRPPP
ncbi:MAG TPA: L-dopachrome tautomerase-related protein [Candidatus Binatia bacterium]|nr:L-dopachrome tautomerase-related protein [Candidatus Binatia bacterium]